MLAPQISSGVTATRAHKIAAQDGSVQATTSPAMISKRSAECAGFFRSPLSRFNDQYLRCMFELPSVGLVEKSRAPVINLGYYVRVRAIEDALFKAADAVLQKHRKRSHGSGLSTENGSFERDWKSVNGTADLAMKDTVLNAVHETTYDENFDIPTSDPSAALTVVNLGCGMDTFCLKVLSDENFRRIANLKVIDIDFPDIIASKQKALDPFLKQRNDCQRYEAIGCDLRNIDKLVDIMHAHISASGTTVFLLEVVLTYIDYESADRLLKVLSKFQNSHLIVLEQYLPAPLYTNPFARTMVSHFKKIKAPLQAIEKYPTLDRIRKRVIDAGWRSCHTQPLLNFWNSLPDRRDIINVQPFDEWEEFYLFLQHYFILHASGTKCNTEAEISHSSLVKARNGIENSVQLVKVVKTADFQTANRPATLLNKAYTNTDEFLSNVFSRKSFAFCQNEISGNLSIIGGRKGPGQPLGDSLRCQNSKWIRTDSELHTPRFRHCACQFDAFGQTWTLVYGGRSAKEVISQWEIISSNGDAKWQQISCPNDVCLMGCSMIATKVVQNDGFSRDCTVRGLLVGGLDEKFCPNLIARVWILSYTNNQFHLVLLDATCENSAVSSSLCRIGANFVNGPRSFKNRTSCWLLGGVGTTEYIPASEQVLALEESNEVIYATKFCIEPSWLLVNFSAAFVDGMLEVGGGWMNCFSFGRYSNPAASSCIIYQESLTMKPNFTIEHIEEKVVPSTAAACSMIFDRKLPVVFKNNDIGTCKQRWTDINYLGAHLPDGKYVVHEGETGNLVFSPKNFKYKNISREELLARIMKNNEPIYFRSLASVKPLKQPASFRDDFPEIADDFSLPQAINEAIACARYTDPLRVSGPNVDLWLHYDVMDNVLVQIVGRKRVTLFDTSDINKLGFTGDSSSSPLKDFDSVDVKRYEAVLEPGDILYIPSLWPHATTSLEPTININIFWKNLDEEQYAIGRDLYGNKDLKGFNEAFSHIKQARERLQTLSDRERTFYLKKLSLELLKDDSK